MTVADLRFINLVAARRFAGAQPGPIDEGALESVLSGSADGTPFARAAALAAAVVRRGVVASAPLHTAVLAMHCSLRLDGFSLLTPQGVLAAMIRGLAAGGEVDAMARWLRDRAVPSASGD